MDRKIEKPRFPIRKFGPIIAVVAAKDSFAARMGGGMDYYFTENIYATLGVTYVLGTGPLKDADFVSADWGGGYRF